jgi:predicted dehydrogenase
MKPRLGRRSFLKSAAAAGAALTLAGLGRAEDAPPPSETINVALIGAGRHGRDLLNYGLKIPGVRFKAVADVWPFAQKYSTRLLAAYKQPATAYEDYREMLAAEKDLQAALVVTPDAFHADQTVDCLNAGLHVFCEKEMHNTLDGARRMVKAARETGKLLQIGRQHRSNPRYLAALDYLQGKKALGRLVHVGGQWHGHKRVPYKWPEKDTIADATLAKYGFASMQEHRDWRWSKKFSAGPIANLGSHQVDVFNWFLGVLPCAVLAAGGRDYYDFGDWYDNCSCIFEWDLHEGAAARRVRGDYHITTSADDEGFFEVFTGDEGGLTISEDPTKGGLRREQGAPEADWEAALKAVPPGRNYPPIPGPEDALPVHAYHLKNFFDAVCGRAKLTCPADVAYTATVSVLKVNEAVEAGRRLEYKAEEFTA